MIALSALTFFVVALSLHYLQNEVGYICFLFIITGFVASSRLAMQAHTPKELLVGYLVGMLPQIGLWYFWL